MVNPINAPIEFRDESSENKQEESSITEIILRQIRKLGDICSEELTGGYWEEKPVKTGGGVVFTKEYHLDTREAYCNAVEFITDLVFPYADAKLKPVIQEADKLIDEDIKQRLINRKKLFRELNSFFVRDDFFSSSDSEDE